MVFETHRLSLRELTTADAPHFFALNADPEVLRYTGDAPFEDLKAAQTFLENYKPYQQYGYGRWAVIRKTDGVFLGWCGLKFDPLCQETDIGFRFYTRYWTKGYATEAAEACLAFGFSEKKLPYIVGRAMEGNTASIRVLEKLGMRFWKRFDFGGERGVVYRLDSINSNDPQRSPIHL